MSRLDEVMWRPNAFFGLWLWSLAVVFSGCGAALMTADQIVGPLATIAGAIITSTALLVAALFAWRSVQERIDAERREDRNRFQAAVTAELVTLSDPVIRATSNWNARAREAPNEVPPRERWPVLPRPGVYEALVSRIGSLEGWIASAVIAFYGEVLDLREMSSEAMQGRPTFDVNASTLAKRFRDMALNLAYALDGLTENRPFLHQFDTRTLFLPSGERVATLDPLPRTLQELLRAIGGRSARPDVTRIA